MTDKITKKQIEDLLKETEARRKQKKTIRRLEKQQKPFKTKQPKLKKVLKAIKEFKKVEKKQQRGRRLLEQLKYKRSVAGKIQRGVRFLKHPIKSLYGRKMTLAQRKQMLSRLKKFKKPKFKRIIMPPRQLTPTQKFYNFCFESGDQMAPVVEAEIFNHANGGFSNDGDRTGFQLGREAEFFGSIASNPFLNHIQNITDETSIISNIIP